MKRVVITGMGALSSIGKSIPEMEVNLFKGFSGAGPITYFDTHLFKTKIAAEIKNYQADDYFPKSEHRKYDLYTQYALITTREALQQSGLLSDTLDPYRVGVIWGSGNGGILTTEQQIKEYALGDGTPRFNPFFVPKMLIDSASGMISLKWGFKGINHTTVSACASATTAIIEAFQYIKWGKADAIICGGSDAPINATLIGGFNALKALSTQNDAPSTASKPFDIHRDGFVMGEGSATLVLESLEHAIERGATILGEIVGTGMCADAYHMTGSHPEGDGAFRGMSLALEEASINAHQIDYINPHATSTPVGDESELKAIQRFIGDSTSTYISATKSMTGHLLGAAGAIESVICLLSIQHQSIPPTINTLQPLDMGNLQLVTTPTTGINIEYALNNTFGFGGHIASILFKKYSA
ncbi:MAG: beta-ketoacyl-ACP synthase II [Cytophagaceae bacterium]|jgi:3-oxoacyl-[acyl-carrier-protein] synthase II|nr:beta-ketoacyl-ACP synthase II [Cytophagaceae bacterium]